MEMPNSHKNELNRDVPFSQQQNRPYLSVIISSCDLQGGGANGLLLQKFSLWVAGWLEVGGVIQINGDVDEGNIEFWIHWVVVQSPHGQLQKKHNPHNVRHGSRVHTQPPPQVELCHNTLAPARAPRLH